MINRRLFLAVPAWLCVMAFASLPLQDAYAVPLGWTSQWTQGGKNINDNQNQIGPVYGGVNLPMDNSGYYNTPNGKGEYEVLGSVLTNFGDGVVSVASIDAQVTASAKNPTGASVFAAYGLVGGLVDVAFTIDEKLSPPHSSASGISLLFTSHGQANVNAQGDGGGEFIISTGIKGVLGTFHSVHGLSSGEFNVSDLVWLSKGTTYWLEINAVAEASALAYPNGEDEASTTAFVDPMLSFDQTAFDAQMGANTFQLADYYTLSFSPNVPQGSVSVPEPATLALVALGLVGMRRRKAGTRFGSGARPLLKRLNR